MLWREREDGQSRVDEGEIVVDERLLRKVRSGGGDEGADATENCRFKVVKKRSNWMKDAVSENKERPVRRTHEKAWRERE